jgi:imidazolonepropionase-like amidohydrolase
MRRLALVPLALALTAPRPEQVALHALQLEAQVASILRTLEAEAPKDFVVLRDVQVVDPAAASVTAGQTVIVRNGRIAWIGPVTDEPTTEGAFVVNGGGSYLAPGLVDMHIHSGRVDQRLLTLANGVTSVRDMDGFPWILRLRDSIARGRALGPTYYVAGTIVNAQPMDGYAVVPHSIQEGRRIVRDQAACGYDFIKIHNLVPKPLFDALADESRKAGLDLVGHVPHDIPVRYAVQGGIRTMEHVKGFLDDATLTLGDADYAAVEGQAVWNTPTLAVAASHFRGASAREVLARPTAAYVPASVRQEWAALVDAPVTEVDRLRQNSGQLMTDITRQLVAHHARLLAGTDTGGYPFMVMGFTLVEEVGRLEAAGLTPAQALATATTEPAAAMRRETELGRLARGLRADAVLLEANPLKGASALKANRGVMAQGRWLSRDALDRALGKLAALYAVEDDSVPFDSAALAAAIDDLEAQSRAGAVFDADRLTDAASTLRAAGAEAAATRLETLADVPRNGPCAANRPR